jgi:peptide/nickel transport system substrate-binding protein
MQQAVRSQVTDPLLFFSNNGRPVARLAESWSSSEDGRVLRLHLRKGVIFHNGALLNASIVSKILSAQLKTVLAPIADRVERIAPASEDEVVITLREPSAFLLEALSDAVIEVPGMRLVGTGPFMVSSSTPETFELKANPSYYRGGPVLGRVVMKAYSSVRAAWADLLRGQVDVLYEVGVEAMDSLESSTAAQIITYRRPYQFLILLNTRAPALRTPSVRRALNAAVDRPALIAGALNGHGTAAEGLVWPSHWAFDASIGGFKERTAVPPQKDRLKFTCLVPDPSMERLALVAQQQLSRSGVDMELVAVPLDETFRRVAADEFDAVFLDAGAGPQVNRTYQLWHSKGIYNISHFASQPVDAALDAVSRSRNERSYREGVAALQRAVLDDPPAIFLAWSERARAISRRFAVPTLEPGSDPLTTLRLWTPIGVPAPAHQLD